MTSYFDSAHPIVHLASQVSSRRNNEDFGGDPRSFPSESNSLRVDHILVQDLGTYEIGESSTTSTVLACSEGQ